MSTPTVTIEMRTRPQRWKARLLRLGMVLGTGDPDILAAILSRPDREGRAFAEVMRP